MKLTLAGRARSVKDEKRVLRVHLLRRAVRPLLGNLLVPPDISGLVERHVVLAGPLENNAALDERAFKKSLVGDLLEVGGLATAETLVRGDDDLGAQVLDTVAESLGREAGKDHTVRFIRRLSSVLQENGLVQRFEISPVDGTDPSTTKHGVDGFGDHGHVNDDGVALLDAVGLEHVGSERNLLQELSVGNVDGLAGFVRLPDDGNFRGVLVGVAVDWFPQDDVPSRAESRQLRPSITFIHACFMPNPPQLYATLR